MYSLLFLLFLCFTVKTLSLSFSFDIEMGEKFCIDEFLSHHTLVDGYFKVSDTENPLFDILIQDPNSEPITRSVYAKDHVNDPEIKGVLNFKFATYYDGDHKFCLGNLDTKKHKVEFSLKTGIEAKDYSKIAKKEEINDISTETKNIKQTVLFIKNDFNAISDIELYKIYRSGAISSNVVWFSISTTIIIVIVGILQYSCLRNFFRKKKII